MLRTSTVKFNVLPQVMSKHLGSDLYQSPDRALRELVANSLDADCSHVNIDVVCNEMWGPEKITISDDGRGISPQTLEKAFCVVGQHVDTVTPKRQPIGSKGIGKFAVFALAAKTTYETVAAADGARIRQTWTMKDLADSLTVTREDAPDCPTGTIVTIIPVQSDAVRKLFSSAPWLKRHLFNDFASYLLQYQDQVNLYVNGEKLDLGEFIEHRDVEDIVGTERVPEARLHHILLSPSVDQDAACMLQFAAHGARISGRAIDSEKIPGKKYLGLVDSPYLAELTTTSKSELANLDPRFLALQEEAIDRARQYIADRQGDHEQSFLEEARRRPFYPFRDPPKSPIDQYSQDVFDNMLLVMEKHAEISKLPLKHQQMLFRLTRQMLQSDDLATAVTSVLDLKGDDVSKLVDLLQRTSLSSIISVSELLLGRFQFLDELKAMMYGRTAEYVKERSNLQRILEGHTWIFGEQYNLMSSDRSLKNLLPIIQEHVRPVEDEEARVAIDPKLRDIPDFYLLTQKWNEGAKYFQHLVVEMKAPSVRILPQHVDQLERYARQIVKHSMFSQGVNSHKFTFVLVSSEVSSLVKDKYQEDEEPGLISRPRLGHPTELWARQWSDVLDSRCQELEFLRGKLEILGDPQDLEYLRRKVGKFLPAEIARIEPNGHETSDS